MRECRFWISRFSPSERTSSDSDDLWVTTAVVAISAVATATLAKLLEDGMVNRNGVVSNVNTVQADTQRCENWR